MAGDAYSISCMDTEEEFTSLIEIFRMWEEEGSDRCYITLLNPSVFSPNEVQAKAIKTYGDPFDPEYPGNAGTFHEILSMCADDAFPWDLQEPSDAKAVLLLCPEIPGAKRIKLMVEKSLITNDGDWKVGDEIRAGTWKTTGSVSDCYWERTSSGGDTISNNFITFAKSGVTVRVSSTDGSFSTEGCGEWRRIG